MAGFSQNQGKKVLVVEDDQAMAVGLRDGIAYDGYGVL